MYGFFQNFNNANGEDIVTNRLRYIYRLTTSCGKIYVGQTLDHNRRHREHRYSMKNRANNTLGRHAQNCFIPNCEISDFTIIEKAFGRENTREVERECIHEIGELNIQHRRYCPGCHQV